MKTQHAYLHVRRRHQILLQMVELPSWFLGIVLGTSGTPALLLDSQSMIRTYTVYSLYPGSNVNSKVNIKIISLCRKKLVF